MDRNGDKAVTYEEFKVRRAACDVCAWDFVFLFPGLLTQRAHADVRDGLAEEVNKEQHGLLVGKTLVNRRATVQLRHHNANTQTRECDCASTRMRHEKR